MRTIGYLLSTLLVVSPVLSLPQSWKSHHHTSKPDDAPKVGYLAVYWTTANESVYFALSSNDDPLNFQPINGGNPIMSPTLGMKAIRDTSLIKGHGHDAGKYWIIGTDLDIGQTNWDAATRTGSRGILVWDSEDLVTWKNERLITVEDETAGMAWAPDAIWDPEQGQYLVHWASQLYSPSDTNHTGDPTLVTSLRYAHTRDFKTFTRPQTYLTYGGDTTVIDLSFLPLGHNSYLRFSRANGLVSVEISTNGLFGNWTTPAGSVENSGRFEGPYPFWDNEVDGLAYLLCDRVGTPPGVEAWVSTDPDSGLFTTTSGYNLTFMRHLSVTPVTQKQYNALEAL